MSADGMQGMCSEPCDNNVTCSLQAQALSWRASSWFCRCAPLAQSDFVLALEDFWRTNRKFESFMIKVDCTLT